MRDGLGGPTWRIICLRHAFRILQRRGAISGDCVAVVARAGRLERLTFLAVYPDRLTVEARRQFKEQGPDAQFEVFLQERRLEATVVKGLAYGHGLSECGRQKLELETHSGL